MNVVGRIDRGAGRGAGGRDRRRVDRRAVEHGFHGGKAQRPVGGTDDADMRIGRLAAAVEIIKHRRRREREIAMPAGEFDKAEPPRRRPRRQADRGDDFVGLERRHQRPEKKLGRRDLPRAVLAGDGDLGVAGDGDTRHLRGGIGVRDAAADGAAVADLIMRDMADGGDKERMRAGQARIVENVPPAHHGAELDAVIRNPDVPQLFDLAQIDDERRRGDAERQHRHQTLPAGERLGVAAMRGKKRESFREAGRDKRTRRAGASCRRSVANRRSGGKCHPQAATLVADSAATLSSLAVIFLPTM